MKFEYSATTRKELTKDPIHGIIEAESKEKAMEILRAKGLSVYKLEKHNKKKWHIDIMSLRPVSRTDIVLFTKNLAVMMKAGLTLAESLHISLDQANGKMKSVLNKILKHVENGEPFSKALQTQKKYFPRLYQDIVHVGEVSGTLDRNLQYLADQLAKDRDIIRKIWGAMLYPIFIIFGIGSLLILLSVVVLPRLTTLFLSLEASLPLPTRILIWFSEFLQQNGLYVLVGAVTVFVAFLSLYRIPTVKYVMHSIYLHLPLFGRVFRQVNNARLTRTLGALLESGLPLSQSLEAGAEAVGNMVYQSALKKVSADVFQGASLTDSLEKFPRLFPRIISRMVHVGENSGRLDSVLLYVAQFYEEEFEEVAKNLTILLEPFLLVLIGAVVGFIGLSIITPIYQITSSIG